MIISDIEQVVALAIAEDLGSGDHTSLACIPADAGGAMRLLVKQPCVLAGIEAARYVFKKIDAGIVFEPLLSDGAAAEAGMTAFRVEGRTQSLLQAERIALNFMQRMSGIATTTALYVRELAGLKTKVIDTRKTTPALRYFEKMAVRLGGGANHRMGLYDMILIKDNHIDFAGGIGLALERVRSYLAQSGLQLDIEIEARTLADVQEILRIGGVARIMLDNFGLEDTRLAVEMISGRCEVESSGGITLPTLRSYALCGVDYISVGALTHHIQSVDMSLKAG